VIGCAEDRPTIPGRGQLQGDAPIQSDRSQSRWPGSTLQNKDTRFRGVENTKGSGPGSRLLPYRRPRPSGAPIEHREYESPHIPSKLDVASSSLVSRSRDPSVNSFRTRKEGRRGPPRGANDGPGKGLRKDAKRDGGQLRFRGPAGSKSRLGQRLLQAPPGTATGPAANDAEAARRLASAASLPGAGRVPDGQLPGERASG
jgi:hypothetical protein